MSPKWKKISALVAAGVFFALVVMALTFFRGSTPTLEEPRQVYIEGDTVSPTLALVPGPGAKGATFGDFRGKVTLINFWAGWCAPCLKEMPSLYKLHEKYQAKNFEVVTFNMDETPADGFAALERIAGKAPFPLYVGYEQAVFNHFPVEGLPFTALLNREGKVIYAQPGERDWMDAASQKLIEDLL
ncbi:MAG: TlpA family protein disulfide reductase [Proteobacteria bacterium]|nr:MAG: TlpA family protein disulfide reductase [Pseudomonadota bacterium]